MAITPIWKDMLETKDHYFYFNNGNNGVPHIF